MKEYHRVAGPPFDVVKPDPVYIEEAARRRIITLRFVREMSIDDGGESQSCKRYCGGNKKRRSLAITTLTWNCSTKSLQ
jgi:hypothetical protein